jgi:hypothetical protein
LGDDPILKQLEHILDLLNTILDKMDDIGRPKGSNVLWRVFFPYGEFARQGQTTKEAAAMMVDVQHRLEDMITTLEERKHPLVSEIRGLNYLDLDEMSEQLIELPARYQYMGPQVDELRFKVEQVVKVYKKKK